MREKPSGHYVTADLEVDCLLRRAAELGALSGLHDLDDPFPQELEQRLRLIARSRFRVVVDDPKGLSSLVEDAPDSGGDQGPGVRSVPIATTPVPSWRSSLAVACVAAAIGFGLETFIQTGLGPKGWLALLLVAIAFVSTPAAIKPALGRLGACLVRLPGAPARAWSRWRLSQAKERIVASNISRRQYEDWIQEQVQIARAEYDRYRERGARAKSGERTWPSLSAASSSYPAGSISIRVR